MKFSDKIQQLRDAQKMSQEELSEASGISTRTIQRVEKGEVSPRPYTARKLLEALNTSLEALNANTYSSANTPLEESTSLNRFILSNFLIFLLPIVSLIFLVAIWKKRKWSNTANFICKKILSFQVIWTILSTVVLLLTLFFIRLFEGQYVVGKSLPTPILVYLGLSLIATFIVLSIAGSPKDAAPKWTAIIPNLF